MGYSVLYSTLHPNHFLLIGAKEKMITGLKLELRRRREEAKDEWKAEARKCLEEQGRRSSSILYIQITSFCHIQTASTVRISRLIRAHYPTNNKNKVIIFKTLRLPEL